MRSVCRLLPLILAMCFLLTTWPAAFAVTDALEQPTDSIEQPIDNTEPPSGESGPEVEVLNSALADNGGTVSGSVYASELPRINYALADNGGRMFVGENTISNPDTSGITALNNGQVTISSGHWNDFENVGGNYPSYYNGYSNDARIYVEFKKAYMVDEVNLYLFYDNGGCMVPSEITVQYWDAAESIFKDVANQSPYTGFVGNVSSSSTFNPDVITFTPVETSRIQLVVKHGDTNSGQAITNNAAVWLSEFQVYGDAVRSNAALAVNGGQMFVGENTISNNTTSGIAALNNGQVTISSGHWNDFEIVGGDYPSYYNGYSNDARIFVKFKKAYTVDEVDLYLLYDNGGCMVPSEITVQYWDAAESIFKDVANQSPYTGFVGNMSSSSTFNPDVISFTPVETSRIQLVVKHGDTNSGRATTNNAAVWLSEFEVYTYDSVEEADKEGEVEIPPVAATVTGVSNPVIDLNARNGTWQFLSDPPTADVPIPEWDDNQDFDFTAWADEDWNDVIVPGGLVMQGFDIKNNIEYYYQRQVTIPNDYFGNRIIIRFDAVYTNTRVWVDGQYVRTHKGGFTTWDCDITDFVSQDRPEIMLTVGVTDLYGNTVGVWNTSGSWKADPSGATYYANHNIGGITRDVSLIALPKDYIARIYTNTVFTDDTFTDIDLEIKAQLGMVSEDASLLLEVVNKSNTVEASDTIDFILEGEGQSALKEKTIRVTSPLKWDAEHPNLYTLRATLLVDEAVKEVSTQRFGFRQIDFGGSYGDVNKVYINGKEVKLRGVNRHDVSWELGRSITKDMAYQEIRDYKDANINFIRTSHYPVSKHLLDACDELGIYIEEENAACWGPVGCPPEEYLNGFKEVVERDRNRACILIWSLANESSWAEPFKMEYDYVRAEDPTRLVIFSFPTTVPTSANVHFDIFSVHYDSWNSPNLGSPTIPVLHDEYCPSSVHHYYEIQRDLSSKAFYEQSIYKMWDNVLRTDGALGGAVWCADDEVFFIPEGTTKNTRGAQGYYDGYTAGDGAWGNVHDAYKRLKTEAWLTKKGYSPVRLNEKVFTATPVTLSVPVRSGFDHTDFSELTIRYSIDDGVVKNAMPPSIAPHDYGNIIINDSALDGAKRVNLKFYTTFNGVETMVDEFNIDLKRTIYEFEPGSPNPPAITDDNDLITVSGPDFSVVFDKAAGLIKQAKYKNDVLITSGPYLHVTDADFGDRDNKWVPAGADAITAKIEENLAVITLKGAYARGQGVEFTVTISGNGIITTDYKLTTRPEDILANYPVREVGVSYKIPSDIKSVDWTREAFHNAYPDNNIARNKGEALKVRPGYETNPDVYGQFPDWDWYMDMNEFSLFVPDDPRDGIVTNDFKTMREKIWYYDVNFSGTDSKISVQSDTGDAARVEVMPAWELVDCTDEQIQYYGNWTARNNQTLGFDLGNGITNNYAFNHTEMTTSTSGAYCELEFQGTGVSFISSRQAGQGWLRVYIDGNMVRDVDSFGGFGGSKRRVLYSINGLDYGAHTIKVERIDGTLTLDAFGVLKGKATDQALQESRLIVNQQWYYPDLNWGSYAGTPGILTNGTSGSATIRLTDTDNLIPVEIEPDYIPVTDITGVPETMVKGINLTLSATIVPANATNQNIIWSVKDAGTTGATIAGNALRTTGSGFAVITATIDNYTKDFTVMVRENVALASNGGVMYKTPETYQERDTIYVLNNATIGKGGGYWADWKPDYVYANHATIGVKLDTEYKVDAIELFIMNDGGGCYPPSRVTIQYWNGSTYVPVSNQSPTTGFRGDTAGYVGNLITFDAVTTTDIRVVMEHGPNEFGQTRAIALTEFAVYKYDAVFGTDREAPTVVTTILPGGTVGIAYNQTLAATGDTPIIWTIDAGSLPGGLTLSSGGVISGTPAANGTFNFTVKAVNSAGDDTKALSIVINAASTGDGGSGSGTRAAPAPTYTAVVSGIGTGEPTLPVNVNTDTGNVTTDLGTLAGDIFSGTGTAVITAPSIPGMNSYTLGIPAASLSGSQGEGTLTYSTGTGSLTIPGNMLAGFPGTEGSSAGITIGQGDKSGLPDEVQTTIGDRPIIQLTLTLDGEPAEWNNPGAPVTISIPYKPTAEELANPQSIIIWYLDGSGNPVCVPNGRYDPATGMVTFSTTHFSLYAVGYNHVSFNDVADTAWYNKAVSFIAARGITSGTGNGNYSPGAKLTRGEFIVLMMKAYGIAPDENPTDNFSDAGDTYYSGYLATAKRLGISSGVGNNMFAPGKEITRQEMFTLLYNALKVIGQLPQGDSGKTLNHFADAGQIDSWAKDAMALLVETGTVGGSAGKLTPLSTTTRAEMAQVLYNLLGK